MNTTKILELLSYTIPAIVTGLVAFYFFNLHINNEANRRKFAIQRTLQKKALPLRLQAYERMVLFLERINPAKLLLRVAPVSDDKNQYAEFVIQNIENEFEHNLTQQIYLSEECWNVILAAKNATINIIRKAASHPETTSAQKLRENILKDMVEKQSPSNNALAYIKNEVSEMW
ncbi:hypothetical protein GV828_02985 [Flavobacterium sp. NST-5]|uniref:Uncharacterized protein n=1 Tax=Flavobacterium ichthyis TaxID=2698827 RepID=A0ABW9Z6G1_9FLAO|nr:hypothetical protein [Flavobacterium ichthyis]NBL64162.1 hypothetical protein [Flavobacterium ichthyis]